MISWIQITFQRHFRTMFAVLLAVVIISFVFTIGASPGIGRAGHKLLERPFFGYNLSSAEDTKRIFGDASLSVYLQAGYMALEGDQLQKYALRRTAGLALADQLHVPAPTSDDLAKFVTQLRSFQDEKGQFDHQRYDNFRDQLATNPQFHEADVARVLADDFRYQKVQKIVSGPGYVLPGDVKTQLALADSTWTIAVATADYASFAPDLAVKEDELAKFFQENSFRYEVPPRAVVDYVEFKASDNLGRVTAPADADVQAYYEANKERFAKAAEAGKDDNKPALKVSVPTDAATPAAGAEFAAVRPKVEAALKLELAQQQAAKAASDFTLGLYEQKISAGSPEFDRFISEQKQTLKSLPPLTRDTALSDPDWPVTVNVEAFKLGPQRFYSDPVTLPNGDSIVLLWKETLPSYQATLAQAHAKVLADYRDNEKRKRFVETGRILRDEIASRLKAGDTFAKAVAVLSAAHQIKVEVKSYPAFPRRTPPAELDHTVLSALEHLDKGGVSAMVVAENKGYLVYAQDHHTPLLTEDNPQYAATRAQLMQLSANISQGLYLEEMVEAELAKSAPATAMR